MNLLRGIEASQAFLSRVITSDTSFSASSLLPILRGFARIAPCPVVKTCINEFYERFQDNRRQVREEARQQIHKIQEENCRSFNENRIPAIEDRIGDVVAVVRKQWGPSLKLSIRSFGPYRITKVKENDWYDVEKIGDGDGSIYTNAGAEDITPWRGHADDLDSFYDLDDLGDEANDKV